MKINIFLNKKFVRNRYILDCLYDYSNRCRRYININIVYEASGLSVLNDGDYNINICKSGKYMDSVEFSNILDRCAISRIKNVNVFFGLSDICNRNDICFCNVDLEYSGFLYCMVLEQIYRAYKIINGEPYHK